MPDPPAITPLPTAIGPFTIVDGPFEGGLSWVYKATLPVRKDFIAVKVAHDRWYQALFAEAEALRELDHPHIVKILPVGPGLDDYIVKEYLDGEPKCYIAMEFVEGGSLNLFLRTRRPTPGQILRVIQQIASALDYAHSKKVVHLDVKPSNILMNRDGRRAVLTDFGIVRRLEDEDARYQAVGTPQYMAPEHARAEPVDYRSDLYSLGAILYELYTGRPPYQGESSTVLRQVRDARPFPVPRTIRPGVPPAVEKVILRALAPDPAQRYQSGAALVADLRHATPRELTPMYAAGAALIGMSTLAVGLSLFTSVFSGSAAATPVRQPTAADTKTSTSISIRRVVPPNVTGASPSSRLELATPTAIVLLPSAAVPTDTPGRVELNPTSTLAVSQTNVTVVVTLSPTSPPEVQLTATAPARPTATAPARPTSSATLVPTPSPTSASDTPTPSPFATIAPTSVGSITVNPPAATPGQVMLTWTFTGSLGFGEQFDVLAWRSGESPHSITNTTNPSYRIGGNFPVGTYDWSVGVINRGNGKVVVPYTAGSPFTWNGSTVGSPGSCVPGQRGCS